MPAIVAQMDERRPLLSPQIRLRTATDAFEPYRYYGPKLVVDGLDAILNQITGEGGAKLSHGGSERERLAAVAGWRVYVLDRRCGLKDRLTAPAVRTRTPP